MEKKGQNLFISSVFFTFFLKKKPLFVFQRRRKCNQSWMCDFLSLAWWWFVHLLFTKDFIRLAEYSLMKHLLLCKFLLMAGKNVCRAWYTLDSEKASHRFLDWKLQLTVDENNSLPLPLYCVCFRPFLWTPISFCLLYKFLSQELRYTLSYFCPMTKYVR